MSDFPPADERRFSYQPSLGRRRVLYQVHPLTIIYEVLLWVRQMAVPIGIFLYMGIQGQGGESNFLEIGLGFFAGLRIVFAAINYAISRWGFEEDIFLWKTGVLRKQERNIPIDRIQNVEIVRNLAHRMLGLADLKIDTGVGGAAEVRLSALRVEDAQRLQRELLQRKTGAFHLTDEAPQVDHALWKATTRDLVVVGVSENRALVLIGSAIGLLSFSRFGGNPIEAWIDQSVRSAVKNGGGPSPAIFVGGAIVLLLIGWISSIANAFIRYHGFTITQKGDRIVREFGLFTHMSTAIPIRRVQVFSARAGWVKRLIGFWSTECSTAGSVLDLESKGGSNVLCPVVETDQIARFVKLIFEDVLFDRAQWTRVSRKTIRRHAFRYAFIPTMVTIGLSIGLDKVYLAALVPIIGLAIFAAYRYYEVLGYARYGRYTMVWTGLLTQTIYIVPDSKIQSLSLEQSPFQRAAGLANLTLNTAGHGLGSIVAIPDLDAETADQLRKDLQRAAGDAGAWSLDGV